MTDPVFAVVGDVHGRQLDMIALLNRWQERSSQAIDFVLQVGDFEAVRKRSDLETMVSSAKKQKMGHFKLFVQGRARFPWPLYFIGGNHEPYGYLSELKPLTEIVPNCFYLGRVGAFEFMGLSIHSLSGIYQSKKFSQARIENDPDHPKNHDWYNAYELEELKALGPCDILLLHDWPTTLVPQEKEAAMTEARRGIQWSKVGSPPTRKAILQKKPKIVFCGHMHCSLRTTLVDHQRSIPVHCLNAVSGNDDCFAVYRFNKDRRTFQALHDTAITLNES